MEKQNHERMKALLKKVSDDVASFKERNLAAIIKKKKKTGKIHFDAKPKIAWPLKRPKKKHKFKVVYAKGVPPVFS